MNESDSQFIHVALSVDVDRFSDETIRREYLPMASRSDGAKVTLQEFRQLCQEARENGLAVFPPCERTGSDGRCLGHREAE